MSDTLRMSVATDPGTDPSTGDNVDVVGQGNQSVSVTEKPPVEKQEDQKPERPAWLDEKFKTPEDLAKAYTELQKKLGSGEKPVASEKTITPESAKTAGVDMDALSREYVEKGALSADSMKKLAAAGFTEDVVNRYVAGQKAVSEAMTASLYAVTGGEDQFKAVMEWGGANLPAATVKAYNDAVNSGNIGLVEVIARGVLDAYRQANGKPADLVNGSTTGRSGDVKPFASNAELVEAINNPKYEVDEAYRAKVEKRLAVSTMFGM